MIPRGEIRVSQAETDQRSRQREQCLPSRTTGEYMVHLGTFTWLEHGPVKDDGGAATVRCYNVQDYHHVKCRVSLLSVSSLRITLVFLLF